MTRSTGCGTPQLHLGCNSDCISDATRHLKDGGLFVSPYLMDLR